jgi:hypothetical protein
MVTGKKNYGRTVYAFPPFGRPGLTAARAAVLLWSRYAPSHGSRRHILSALVAVPAELMLGKALI